MTVSQRTRRNISRGIKAKYRNDPDYYDRIAEGNRAKGQRLAELVALGHRAEDTQKVNLALEAKNQQLREKVAHLTELTQRAFATTDSLDFARNLVRNGWTFDNADRRWIDPQTGEHHPYPAAVRTNIEHQIRAGVTK